MIKGRVSEHANVMLVSCLDRLYKFLFRPVFRADSSFLIKFSQIKKIINIVADRYCSRSPFAGRGEPCGGDTQIGQMRGLIREILPERSTPAVVPVEEL